MSEPETITCPQCTGVPMQATGCTRCGTTGRVRLIRRSLEIVFVATVKVERCECGRDRETTLAAAVDQARTGTEFIMECSCGVVIIAQRSLVHKPKLQVVG